MSNCANCGFVTEKEFNFCPACGTQALAGLDRERSLVGSTLSGKYRVLEEIGSGGMGTVYKGEHIGLKKVIALKVLHPDLQLSEENIGRFQREGIAAGKFNHPGAIQIFDFERQGGIFFLAMEFVEGTTLKQWIRQRGTLPLEEALSLADQVLRVLAEAHTQGIVHRDLKPENIMVVESTTAGPTVKVLDFGLSKLVDMPAQSTLHTQTGRILGTPLYMSPEQCAGTAIDARSDLYSVALILFEMIAGHPPFQGSTVPEILYKHTSMVAPSLAAAVPDCAIPVDLEEILQRALEKNPDDRFANASEMLNALRSMRMAEMADPIDRVAATQVIGSPRARSKKFLGVVVAVVFVGALIVVLRDNLGSGFSTPTEAKAARLSLVPEEQRSPEENRYVVYIDQAREDIQKRKLDSAFAMAEKAVEMQCRDAEAYLLRARVHRLRGDPDTAALDLQAALQLDSSYAEALEERGWLSLDAGRSTQALEQFDEAYKADSRRSCPLVGTAVVQFRQGLLDEALASLDAALRLDPNDLEALYYRGRVRLESDPPQLIGAVEDLSEVKAKNSTDWRAHLGLGEAKALQDKPGEAERHFEDAIARNPDSELARGCLSALLIDGGRLDDAETTLREGLSRSPTSGSLRILLAVTLEARGDPAAACAELQQGIEEETLDAHARVLLGQLLHEQGLLPEALAQYEEALLRDPNQEAALLGQAVTLTKLGYALDAVDVLEEAFQAGIGTQNTSLRLTLGVLYMDYLGDATNATLHLESYRDLGGDDPRVAGWLNTLTSR